MLPFRYTYIYGNFSRLINHLGLGEGRGHIDLSDSTTTFFWGMSSLTDLFKNISRLLVQICHDGHYVPKLVRRPPT